MAVGAPVCSAGLAAALLCALFTLLALAGVLLAAAWAWPSSGTVVCLLACGQRLARLLHRHVETVAHHLQAGHARCCGSFDRAPSCQVHTLASRRRLPADRRLCRTQRRAARRQAHLPALLQRACARRRCAGIGGAAPHMGCGLAGAARASRRLAAHAALWAGSRARLHIRRRLPSRQLVPVAHSMHRRHHRQLQLMTQIRYFHHCFL